jgi:hypothetical protein
MTEDLGRASGCFKTTEIRTKATRRRSCVQNVVAPRTEGVWLLRLRRLGDVGAFALLGRTTRIRKKQMNDDDQGGVQEPPRKAVYAPGTGASSAGDRRKRRRRLAPPMGTRQPRSARERSRILGRHGASVRILNAPARQELRQVDARRLGILGRAARPLPIAQTGSYATTSGRSLGPRQRLDLPHQGRRDQAGVALLGGLAETVDRGQPRLPAPLQLLREEGAVFREETAPLRVADDPRGSPIPGLPRRTLVYAPSLGDVLYAIDQQPRSSLTSERREGRAAELAAGDAVADRGASSRT